MYACTTAPDLSGSACLCRRDSRRNLGAARKSGANDKWRIYRLSMMRQCYKPGQSSARANTQRSILIAGGLWGHSARDRFFFSKPMTWLTGQQTTPRWVLYIPNTGKKWPKRIPLLVQPLKPISFDKIRYWSNSCNSLQGRHSLYTVRLLNFSFWRCCVDKKHKQKTDKRPVELTVSFFLPFESLSASRFHKYDFWLFFFVFLGPSPVTGVYHIAGHWAARHGAGNTVRTGL
jgi:hypothetical protein